MPETPISSPPIRQSKREARRAGLAGRAALVGRIDTVAAARAIADHVLATFDPRPGTVVSAFWAVRDELDLRPLLHTLHARGCRCALPVVTAKAAPLTFRAWEPGTPLIVSSFGIPEPGPEQVELLPDLSLVPLLVFDRAGYRLGYGGGFYDRTIARLRAMPRPRPYVAAGVAFAGQEVAHVPREDYDQRLDWILTEQGAVRCGG